MSDFYSITPLQTLQAYSQNDAGNGMVTLTVGAVAGICRQDGSPSQPGDVLSVQPDGSLQTRVAGTAGPFEQAQPSDKGLIYQPTSAARFLVPGVRA
jgi:hypothetical protein